MSDTTKSERDRASVSHSAGLHPGGGTANASESQRIELPGHAAAGVERRVDGPHPLPGDVMGRTDEILGGKDAAARSRATLREDELLLQASQVAETLRRQLHDLERRERELEARSIDVAEQEQQLAVRVREAEDEVAIARQTIEGRDRELAQKITTCEKLLADVKAKESALDAEQQEVEQRRLRMREELGREMAAERTALQQSQREFTEQQLNFKAETDRHRKEHDELLDAVERNLAQEREKLHARLSAELDREKGEFEKLRAQWNSDKEKELAEILREREMSDTALQRAEEELEELRRAQSQDLQRQKESFFAEQQELARQVKQERGVFENRARFQEDHLQKMRAQIEADQREMRTAEQRFRVDLEERATQLRLRANQLNHHRGLLEERETSLAREREVLAKSRLSLAAEVQADKDRHVREHETWQQDRDAQQAEIRRQQDMLSLHAENLENRRARLDQLRTELEETHRQTLEMRMLVEDAWAQFVEAAGEPAAKERMDRAREALSQHYRRLRDGLSQERNDLLHSQTLLQQQKDELRAERQKLGEWAASRNEALKEWQERLERDTETLQAREAAWRTLRDQWMQEKLEAEQIIRDLLGQLAASDADDGVEAPAPTGRRPQAA